MFFGRPVLQRSLSRLSNTSLAAPSATFPASSSQRTFSHQFWNGIASPVTTLHNGAAFYHDGTNQHNHSDAITYKSVAPEQHDSEGLSQGQNGAREDTKATQVKEPGSKQYAAKNDLRGFQVLEESQNLPEEKKGQPTKQEVAFNGANTRLARVPQPEGLRDHKRRINSILKDKGPLSYDWRLPLLELRRHFLEDSSPLSNIDYFTRPKTAYHQFSAYEISRPSEWSRESFATYVDDLSQSKVSRLMVRHLYHGHTTHVLAVRDLLLPLFQNAALQHFVSAGAFESALRFFYRHSMIKDARNLWNLMLERGMEIRPKTFNIALRKAADAKDLHNYTYLLRSMVRLGLRPSEDSWVSLVVVLESYFAKEVVVQNMRQLDILKRTDVIQAVAVNLLTSLLQKEPDADISALLGKFDDDFGPRWFSSGAGNAICKYLCEAGKAEHASQFLDIMIQRRCKPNQGALNILLGYCRRNRDIYSAIHISKLFWSRYQVEAGEYGFHILFLLAWELKLHNVCRVVWWYACIAGALTYRMQELTMGSLLRQVSTKSRNLTEVWKNDAGKVIVGIEGHRSMQEGVKRTVQQLAVKSSTKEHRDSQILLAKMVMQRDLSAYKNYRLDAVHFHEALAGALNRDEEWHKVGLSYMLLREKLTKAIQIPVRQKVRRFVAVAP